MHLFTSALFSNIEEQKCEKDIEQDISSNAAKMCVCRNIKTGHGIALSLNFGI